MLQVGDIIRTGNAVTGEYNYYEITPLTTAKDRVFLQNVESYLISRQGRRPNIESLIEVLNTFATFEREGKVKLIKSGPKPVQSLKPKKPVQSLKPKKPVQSIKPKKPKKPVVHKDVQEKILNPETNRYVSKTSKTGKRILATYYP